jgi:hypothetical protein
MASASYVAAVAGSAAAAGGSSAGPADQGPDAISSLAHRAAELALNPPPALRSDVIPGDITAEERAAMLGVMVTRVEEVLSANNLPPPPGLCPFTVEFVPVFAGALSAPQFLFRVKATKMGAVARALPRSLSFCDFPQHSLRLSFHAEAPSAERLAWRVLLVGFPAGIELDSTTLIALRAHTGWNITKVQRVCDKGTKRLPRNQVTCFIEGTTPPSLAEAPFKLVLRDEASNYRLEMKIVYFNVPHLASGAPAPAEASPSGAAAPPPPVVPVPAADAAAAVPDTPLELGSAVAVPGAPLELGVRDASAPPSPGPGDHPASPLVLPAESQPQALASSHVPMTVAPIAAAPALAASSLPATAGTSRSLSPSTVALPDDKGKRPALAASPPPSGTYSPTQSGSPPPRPKHAAPSNEDEDPQTRLQSRRKRINPAPSPSLFRPNPPPPPSRPSSPPDLGGDDDDLMSHSDGGSFSASQAGSPGTMDEDSE